MKNILNLIFTLLMISGLASTTWARNPAAGNDPNAEMSNLSEAGTLVEGTNFKEQKPVCKACQNRNGVLLSGEKDIFRPGMNLPGSTDVPANGKSRK